MIVTPVSPCCGSQLDSAPDGALRCSMCGHTYPVVDATPVLLASDRSEGKAHEVTFYDEEVDEQWEIERPSGAPALYRWLIAEKLRLALEGVGSRGATALVVCCGSGMDAELVAHRGYKVVACDISLGAARRTRTRADRHGVEIDTVVADAERLPFRDASFDIALVHDGLHHLERPELAVAEMARVARRAVSISEPAAAGVTRLAVRLGLALDVEEAGNYVIRFEPSALARLLEGQGFRRLRAHRYAMYYKHAPGLAVRVLSHALLLRLAVSAFRVANALGGRWGNKMVVVGIR
jgi:SAM-dependent methyltransferase